MENRIGNKAKRLGARRRLKSIMARIAIVMSGIAIFTVVYVLLVPGLTAEWPLQCELEEHIHDESCYTLAAASETETVPAEPELICGVEEAEGHVHSDECYTKLCGALICEDADHEHSDDCYEWTQELTCGVEEAEGHSHSDDCYSVAEVTGDENGDENNSQEEIYELTCGLEEHTHQDGCYIIPDRKETYYCGFLTEHTHKDDCYFESGELKCNIPEHLHDDSCLGEPVALDESFSAETDDGAVVVSIDVTGEVILPETDETAGFELVLTESDDWAAYEEYETLAAEEGEVLMVQVFNYSLTYGGQEVDLTACEVNVEVTPTEMLEEMINDPVEIMTLQADNDENEEPEDDMAMAISTYSDEEAQEAAYAVTQGLGANPSFTVQYYANLERAVKSTSGSLPVIDTSDGKLPQNGKGTTTSPNNNPIAYLELNNDGTVKTENTLTEIYQEETFEYRNAPGLKYFNIVLNNKDSQYTLKYILVKYTEESKMYKEEIEWQFFGYNAETRFTNRFETAQAKENYILIDDGAVIRLVYDTVAGEKNFPANFYDYDISNGKVYRANATSTGNNTFSGGVSGLLDSNGNLTTAYQNWRKGLSAKDYGSDLRAYMYTRFSGINSDDNYTGSGAKLAFGNANTNTGRNGEKWGDNVLNVYNSTGFGATKSSYQGCTFGLANSLNDGKIVYRGGLNVPKLFNEGSAVGKTSYDKEEYSLNFERVGDTYTLSAVNGTGAKNLGTFTNPANSVGLYDGKHYKSDGKLLPAIWTNNFWPMDSAPSWGTDGHDFKFGRSDMYTNKTLRSSDPTTGSTTSEGSALPESDDGQYHNSYFGMQYAVTFDLSASYIGPLEYYFFGDDDMWVFLDNTLVCDLGGVHSSVGEYVNLWDWIDRSELLNADGTPKKVVAKDKNDNPIQAKDKNGKLLFEEDGTTPKWEMTDMVKTYTLTFFYTERGASGSTCWMQFTLPTVVGLNLDSVLDEQVDNETGSLSVEKVLDGVENTDWFTFEISGLDDNYKPDYLLRDANGNLIDNDKITEDPDYEDYILGGDGAIFKIRAGDVLVLRGLPDGAEITVTELDRDGYHTTIEVDGNPVDSLETASVTIEKGHRTQIVYTNHASYELPATGSFGTFLLYASGAALVLLALVLMFNKKTRRKGEASR